MKLHTKNLILNLSYPKVMGILNITPDSFYDGNKYNTLSKALSYTDKMIKTGASIIDVGGESTRPGFLKISVSEELDRVIPILDAIIKRFAVFISIDTSKYEVMKQAIECGVHMINDVSALQDIRTLKIIKRSKVAVCLMHIKHACNLIKNKINHNILKEIIFFLKKKLHNA